MFSNNLLAGKRILVTGGGTGLGKEMADEFLRLGARVYICGRRAGVLEETAEELMGNRGGEVTPMALDIRSPQDVDAVVADIFSQGPLDGLVNNAAGNFISRTQDLSPKGFDAIANIVLHGTFYVTHSVGKRWIELDRGGSVCSILATWVWTGSPFVVPSAMSKSALLAMTRSLAVEWAPRGIRLNAIAPGSFPTKGAWDRLSPGRSPDDGSTMGQNPMGRVGRMQELRNLAVFLMAEGCEYLTGQCIALDGGHYLSAGGTFSGLAELTDEDWQGIRETIRSANEKDKRERSV